MYRVIIIDDEAIIREGVRAIVDWDYYGFEIIGEADNGIDGLKIVLEHQPDLILVDIRMPGYDGIELLEALRNEGYNGKTIILTGHSEFEYAREAIRLGVKAYLLKPIEEDELIPLLEKAKNDLDESELHKKILLNHADYKKVQLLQKLILSDRVDEHLVEELKDDSFFKMKENYHVVIIDRPPAGFQEIDALMESLMMNQSCTAYLSQEHYYIIVYCNKTLRQLQVILQDLFKKYTLAFNQDCFITVGRQAMGCHKIRKSFMDAKWLFERRFLLSQQNIVFWDVHENALDGDLDSIIDSDYLYGVIEVGNQGAIEVFFSKLEAKLIGSSLDVDKIKGICVNSFIMVKEKLVQQYSKCRKEFEDNKAIIDRIYEYNHLSDIIAYMNQCFVNVSNIICDGSNENTMKQLLNYIHQNYYKNLKLEGLARLFNYNSSYLGQIFKEKTGVSFNHYLDQVRIEHAKGFLESHDFKVYEIAERVGYKNVDYFYSKFNKHVGMSPNAYKKKFS